MPTPANTDLFVPEEVNIKKQKQQQGWFASLILLDRWSPFMAACVLCGFRPSNIDVMSKKAEAILFLEAENEGEEPDNYETDLVHGREIIELTRVIATNASRQGEIDVKPSEIVSWGIETGLLPADNEIAKEVERRKQIKLEIGTSKNAAPFLPIEDATANIALEIAKSKNNSLTLELDKANLEISRLTNECSEITKRLKETGKHHAEMREKILAAALHRLAIDRDGCINHVGKVVAAKLAGQVQDFRVVYGFGDEDKNPSASSIQECITAALSEKNRKKSAV